MSREDAISSAYDYFDKGHFLEDLKRRVAIRSESQKPNSRPSLDQYLDEEMIPAFSAMGHDCQIFENPVKGKGPVLLATRMEDESLPTVLGYGHGDVIRGLEDQWEEGLNPWVTEKRGEKLYGRGTADNKGQHTVNMIALACILETRGRLPINS